MPLVSVVAESSGMPYTATLASCTSVISAKARNPNVHRSANRNNLTRHGGSLGQQKGRVGVSENARVMTPRVMHMPRTTDVLRIELPGIFATRTLSVLKLRGLEGIARMHASAILAEKRSSLPYCFDACASGARRSECTG